MAKTSGGVRSSIGLKLKAGKQRVALRNTKSVLGNTNTGNIKVIKTVDGEIRYLGAVVGKGQKSNLGLGDGYSMMDFDTEKEALAWMKRRGFVPYKKPVYIER